jgi:hypothetical protein
MRERSAPTPISSVSTNARSAASVTESLGAQTTTWRPLSDLPFFRSHSIRLESSADQFSGCAVAACPRADALAMPIAHATTIGRRALAIQARLERCDTIEKPPQGNRCHNDCGDRRSRNPRGLYERERRTTRSTPAQRDDRVEPCRAARRNPARHKRCSCEHDGHPDIGRGIGRRDLEEHRSHHACSA